MIKRKMIKRKRKKESFKCGKDKDGNQTVCPSGTTCTQQSQCVKGKFQE